MCSSQSHADKFLQSLRPSPFVKIPVGGSLDAAARGERDICRAGNPLGMQSDQHEAEPSWYVRDRWGLVPTVTGVLIVSYVIATGGEHGAWALWIAIPLLMIGLGYFVVVNAVRYFVD